jgi:hypothetical protein
MKTGELHIAGFPEAIKVVEGLLYSGYSVTIHKEGERTIDDSEFSYIVSTYNIIYSKE